MAATIKGHQSLQAVGNEQVLLAAIAKQPVSVGVDGGSKAFRSYHDGVLQSADCGIMIDHAVLAVGYGSMVPPHGNESVPYIKIKNSWGANWGDHGYIYLGSGPQYQPIGQCGVQQIPVVPIK